MPVIDMDSMVKRTRFCYSKDYLTQLICSLAKPAAMEKNDVISRQNAYSFVIIDDIIILNLHVRWTHSVCTVL